MDVTSALQGITTPLNELYDLIAAAGWEPTKVKFDKSLGVFHAEAQNIHGEKKFATGPTDKVAVAKLFQTITRHNTIRSVAQAKIGMWQTNFVNQLQPIAEAYAKAPIYDPKAAAAFKALADDSVHRAAVLGRQLHIEVVDNPEPYANVQEMANDVHQKKHFYVSRANSEHPVWTVDQNVAFRIVHDVLGHCVAGGDFGWNGENMACAAHFPLLSPIAQEALFTECIAQTAYGAYYRSFGPQKVALFPEFVEGPIKNENQPGHTGIHPSQSIAPTAMPSVDPSAPPNTPNQPGYIAPHQEALGLTPVLTKTAATVIDPNAGYETGVEPLNVGIHGVGNAYLDHGDPLEGQAVMDNAQKIDTQWHSLKTGDGEPDYERMKLAIVNAFRSVLLSPRKDLRWNAIHYQDLSHVPPGVDDPKVYWDTLEKARQEWNVERHGEEARYAHMPYAKELAPFRAIIYQQDPSIGPQGAQERADRLLYQWSTEAHSQALAEDADKPADKQATADEIERKANKILTQRLKMFVKERQTKMDVIAEQIDLGLEDERQAPPDVSRYGAFMGTHLKAISQVSQHVDELLKAALEDVREHDGAGHHFRSKVLQLNIAGVGPKVASFAWLLLQPMTSQLATIDTHMMDVLGHNYEKEMNNRDYFGKERELQAGRDAAGYSHIPLGAFQWGMWDLKRNGPGSHQDHSALRVLDPQPHTSIDWLAKQQNFKGQDWARNAPDWWQNTQAARDQVAADWDQNVAPNFPQNQYPFQVTSRVEKTAKEWDPLYTSFKVPKKAAKKIKEWAKELPGDWERAPSSSYHITFLSCKKDSDEMRQWIKGENLGGLNFKPTELNHFKGRDGTGMIVLELESDGFDDAWDKFRKKAEELNLNPNTWGDRQKAHITIGQKSEPLEEEPEIPDVSFQVAPLVLQESRTAGVDSHSFSYWWNEKKPINQDEAKVMAEYAVATGTSKQSAKDFLSDHQDDVHGDFEDFKKKFFKKFDAIQFESKTAGVIPVLQREDLKTRGRPGQTLMQHITEQTGLTTPEVWEKYEDHDVWKEDDGMKTAGMFDQLKKLQDRAYPMCPCGNDAVRVYDLSDGRKLPVCKHHIESVENPATQTQMIQYAK